MRRRKQRPSLAHYECLRDDCGHKWKAAVSPPAPVEEHEGSGVLCPRCGHKYVKWVNYDKWKAARR